MRGAFLIAAIFVGALLACRGTATDASPMNMHDESTCVQCHKDDFNATTEPMHPGKKPTQCDVCHTQNEWRPSRLAHEWWLVDGAHAKAECFDCHKGEPTVFKGTSKTCASCHRQEEHQANAKLSWHEDVGSRCFDCHTTSAWDPPDPSYHEAPHDTDAGAPDSSIADAAIAADAADAAPPVIVLPHPTVRPHPTTTPSTVPSTAPSTVPSTAPSTVPTTVPTVKPDVISHPSRHHGGGEELNQSTDG